MVRAHESLLVTKLVLRLLLTILLFMGFSYPTILLCYSLVIPSGTFSSDRLVKETNGKVKAGAIVENTT
jgi:hypothetical protein